MHEGCGKTQAQNRVIGSSKVVNPLVGPAETVLSEVEGTSVVPSSLQACVKR